MALVGAIIGFEMNESNATTPEASRPRAQWHVASVAAVFAMAFMAAATTLEARLLPDALIGTHDILRILTTGFLLGYVPIFFLSTAARWLEQRELGRRVQQALFWLPTALAFGLSLAVAVSHDRSELLNLTLGLMGGSIAAVILLRRMGWLPRRLPFWLAPVGLVWVGATFALSLTMRDVDGSLPANAHLLPILAGIAAPTLCLVEQFIGRHWRALKSARKRTLCRDAAWRGAALVALAAGLLSVHLLESWFVGLYLPLKSWFIGSLTVGLWLLIEPLMADWVQRKSTLIALVALALVAAVAGVAATGWMILQPIPARFGAAPANSTVGLSARLLSLADDDDADGFYAESAGGNDCDDSDPGVHPATAHTDSHCWEGLSRQLPSQQPAPNSARPGGVPRAEHVVLVIIDAMRADALDAPDAAERFPNLDAFAAEAAVFERAYAPGNSTMQSILPMLSGVSPLNMLTSMADDEPMGPRQLLAKASVLEGASTEFCTAMLAFTHGAEQWLVDYAATELDVARNVASPEGSGHNSPRAAEAVRQALDTCRDQRLMLVLYVDDPHRDPGGYTCRDGTLGEKECFLQEIEVVDDAFGEVLAMLARRGMRDDSMVVVTADHGEAFGEHAHAAHSSSVFDEQVHVPLLLDVPGVEPRGVPTPVSLLGFKATAAQAAGLPADAAPLYPSWLGLAAGTETDYPPPVTENWLGHFKRMWASPTSAIIVGRHKLIYDWKTTHLRIYDLEADPGELHNIAGDKPALTHYLVEQFKAHQARVLTHRPPAADE